MPAQEGDSDGAANTNESPNLADAGTPKSSREARHSILKHDHDQEIQTPPREVRELEIKTVTQHSVETAEAKKNLMRRKDSIAIHKSHLNADEQRGCFSCFREKPSDDEHAAKAAGTSTSV